MHETFDEELLPSPLTLRRSSLAAVAVGLLLGVTVVLPAEYAIDPTGAGRLLGLTQMGMVKQALAQQQPAQHSTAPVQSQPELADSQVPRQQHTVQLVLQPNEGTEVKLEMPKGARVSYQWSSSGAGLYYDTHGDPYGASHDFYHGYGKGRDTAAQSGDLVAAFDGRHGWYWRNGSDQPVTLTLRTEGQYITIEQIL